MTFPEQFYQPNSLDECARDHQGPGPQATTSPRMEQIVTRFATAYHVDLSQKGANLYLDLADQAQRWMIANIDGERIGVTRCQVDGENRLAPDLDIVFAVTLSGWEPIEILHTDAVWEEYAKSMPTDESPMETTNDFSFAAFADRVAESLEQQEPSEAATMIFNFDTMNRLE